MLFFAANHATNAKWVLRMYLTNISFIISVFVAIFYLREMM